MPNITVPLEIVEKLPKTDLHVHLDGSLRLSTILDLAEKQRIELPAKDEDGLKRLTDAIDAQLAASGIERTEAAH